MIDSDELRAILAELLDERLPKPPPPAPPEPKPIYHPHRVAHKGKVIEEIDKGTGRRYIGPLECPDCGLGLISLAESPEAMACSRLSPDVEGDKGTGGIIACGIEWPE